MGLSLVETLLLAGVLLAWADRVAGGRLLAAFLAAIAVWIAGNELSNWFGPGVDTLALHLLATAPLTSAVFFHFCVVFCRAPVAMGWVRAGYALGALASLASQLLLPARFAVHPDIGRLAYAETAAVITSVSWVVLGIAGVSVLVWTLLRSGRDGQGPARAQVAAVTASCLWGVICLAGYAIALMDWPIYPFPLLALPLYPLMLVYGILRYGVFVANAWAGKALVWTLLLAAGAAIVGLMPLLLPFESRWLSGIAVAAGCLALNGPVRRFVQRLIYPGGEVSAQDLAAWRHALESADRLDTLSTTAATLLSQRLGTPVAVRVDDPAMGSDAADKGHPPETTAALPIAEPEQAVISSRDSTATASMSASRSDALHAPAAVAGRSQPPLLALQHVGQQWTASWSGWDAAPPGQRHVAALFASVLADAAQRVAQAQAVAARERDRQIQARLAELGALAATVAHDIRNPLNIIGMAVALAPSETRQEVSAQVARIAHLTTDLLDYAKPWKLHLERCDLRALVDRLVQREPGVRLGEAWPDALWTDRLDARRIEQALVNLIENARGASPDGCVIDLELHSPDRLRLHVCDMGAGVPADFRDRLFEPFASRSPGGTGLGLAIVARIAQAHDGRVMLTDRPPWHTCFTLELPR